MSIKDYRPPVDRLLRYGDCRHIREWPDYLALGIGPEQIPDLIRMSTDTELNQANSEDLEVWAPIHAWRALGQLRAETAVEPLMGLLEEQKDDDWILEELPAVFGMIGRRVIQPLSAYLDQGPHELKPYVTAITSLELIGKVHQEARSECIQVLSDRLSRYEENSPEINGFIIGSLVQLRSEGSIPTIQKAYASGRVDDFLMSWEDVQKQFDPGGDLDKPFGEENSEPSIHQHQGGSQPRHKSRKARAKRKQSERSRKINRRRRNR